MSEGLQSYIAAEHIDFPVLEEPSADTVAAFRLIATPTTVVVSPQGRILAEWRGAYTGSIAGQIQKFFSLKLPGLVEVASSEPISSPSTPIEKGARTR